MNELIEKYLRNGLADFAGLEITGHVPVKQELINALIADALKPKAPQEVTHELETVQATEDFVAPAVEEPIVVPTPTVAPVAPVTPAAKKSPSIDRKALIELVKSMVHRAEVKAVEGALVLEFEIKR